jgi:hypothetical protein
MSLGLLEQFPQRATAMAVCGSGKLQGERTGEKNAGCALILKLDRYKKTRASLTSKNNGTKIPVYKPIQVKRFSPAMWARTGIPT